MGDWSASALAILPIQLRLAARPATRQVLPEPALSV
jgi:hypothetical protein